MGSYWLCTLATSHSAVVQGQQPAKRQIQRDSERRRKRVRGREVQKWKYWTEICSFFFFGFLCWDAGEHGSSGATWNRLHCWRGLSWISQRKRNVKAADIQSVMLKCEDGVGDDTGCASHCFISRHFSPTWIISQRSSRASKGASKSFISGRQFFFFFDHVPGERKPNSPILSRLHTILPRNEWHSSACRALKCRGTRRQAETFFFCRVCHTPQVATVCFFSEGRLINHEYLMIACSRSDRAPGLMENINVGEGRFDWGAL